MLLSLSLNQPPTTRSDNVLSLLLVEDHPGDALLIRTLLLEAAPRSLQIQVAPTLAEACRQLRGTPVDAVLSDLDLPDCEGFDTLRELLQATETIPILVLTHCEEEAFGLELIKRGASDHLIKGQVDGRLLLKAIRYAIERKETERRFQILSRFDRLTGLANRDHFGERFAQAIGRAERSGRFVALLFLDLDRFKLVNDTYGHDAGDRAAGVVDAKRESST